jgi:hypothetical protein
MIAVRHHLFLRKIVNKNTLKSKNNGIKVFSAEAISWINHARVHLIWLQEIFLHCGGWAD